MLARRPLRPAIDIERHDTAPLPIIRVDKAVGLTGVPLLGMVALLHRGVVDLALGHDQVPALGPARVTLGLERLRLR